MLPLNYRLSVEKPDALPVALTEFTNPVTRTQVKLSPPLPKGPDESMDAFMERANRISAAFDAFCVELWSSPSFQDPVEITFFKPEWMQDEDTEPRVVLPVPKDEYLADMASFVPVCPELPVPVDIDEDDVTIQVPKRLPGISPLPRSGIRLRE